MSKKHVRCVGTRPHFTDAAGHTRKKKEAPLTPRTRLASVWWTPGQPQTPMKLSCWRPEGSACAARRTNEQGLVNPTEDEKQRRAHRRDSTCSASASLWTHAYARAYASGPASPWPVLSSLTHAPLLLVVVSCFSSLPFSCRSDLTGAWS